MAEQAVADRIGISDDTAGGDPNGRDGRQSAGRAALAFIVVLNLLVVGGGAGAYLSLAHERPPAPDATSAAGAAGEAGPAERAGHALRDAPVVYQVPEMRVALNGTEGEAARLRMAVALEVENQAAVEPLEAVLPLVLDTYRVYLSELAVEDVKGPAGNERLREALLMRVNAALGAPRVREVRLEDLRIE